MPNLITTPNNSFQYPSSANNGSDFSTGLQDFADDVDGMWSSGTLASRPAAGTRNRVYYATDTGLLYQDNGSAWSTVMLAGAWQVLNGASNWGSVAQWRTEGDTVRCHGPLVNNTGATVSSGAITGSVLPAPSQTRGAAVTSAASGVVGFTISTGSSSALRITGGSVDAGDTVYVDLTYSM